MFFINTNFRIKASVTMLLIAFVYSLPAQNNTIQIKGIVIDKETNNPCHFTSVSLNKNNLGTIANKEGTFILKIPKEAKNGHIKFSHIGYKNYLAPVKDLRADKVIIKLVPNSIDIETITATPKEPEEIVKATLRNLKQKYNTEPVILEAFYRESIKERRNYQIIAEAVVDIYKAPLKAVFGTDQVRIQKGRKKVSHTDIDTVLVKLRGGPRVLMYLDLIKNPSLILNHEYKKFYTYKLEDIVMANNKAHYIVSFTQRDHVNFPLYDGKFYIDVENLALKEAIFSMNMVNDIETQRRFIRKKPLGMVFKPITAHYHIKYEENNNRWMFNYARAEVEFKCDYRRKLFKNRYKITSEMVVTNRDFTNISNFKRHDRFHSSDVLSEEIDSFTNGNFWGSKNIIDPTSDLIQAISKFQKDN